MSTREAGRSSCGSPDTPGVLRLAGYLDEASTYRSTNDELEDMVRLIKESKLRLQVRGCGGSSRPCMVFEEAHF